jgi:hypothetical protein
MTLRMLPVLTCLLFLAPSAPLAGVPASGVAGAPCAANPPSAAPGVLALQEDKDIRALEKTLRNLIVKNAPNPLYEKNYNWGHTEYVPRGVEWHGRYLPLHPEVQYSDKEDGIWRKVQVVGDDFEHSLLLDIRNVRSKPEGPTLFDLYLAFNVNVLYDQQTWHNGHRLYAGSVRSRMRVKVLLTCEMATHLDFSKGFIPDVTFRLRVVKADLGYDDFVVEHAYGFGGDLAKKMGETAQDWLHDRHPELEQELLTKANAAIVKAADTKEIKLGLGNAFGGKEAKADPLQQLLKKKPH